MTFVDSVAAASCRESDTNGVGGKRKVEALLKVITLPELSGSSHTKQRHLDSSRKEPRQKFI